MRHAHRWELAAFGWLPLVLALGCGGDEALIGESVPNGAPNTEVTAAPPVLAQTSFTVQFHWSGSDPDGEVAGYEWRISDNGRDGVVDVADTLEASLPWRFTTTTDSVFLVEADLDSFALDVADTQQQVGDYRFWQTHTFFIRSVDDEGARDPSPAHVSFTAVTVAPRIEIDVPKVIPTNSCVSGSRVLSYGWTGEDPDNPESDPARVRFLLYPVSSGGLSCLTQNQFEQTAPIRADDPNWSDWIEYDDTAGRGRFVALPRQEVGDTFLFAVQAMDVAGAVTPTFEWNVNVRHVRIGTDKYPALQVNETFLGGELFYARNRVESRVLVSGQPLEFNWSASAEDYAGIIEAYRYGWNVSDPNDPNDPGWAVAWGNGPNWLRAAPRSFSQGSHNFVVQCRDNSGTISRGFYQFTVIQITPRAEQRNLLLVDDWVFDDTPASRALEADWDRRWFEHLRGLADGFQANDVIDAQEDPNRLSFRLINEYKAVVWFLGANNRSFLHTQLAPESTTNPRYNWLEVYQSRVGNLLVVGPGAMFTSLEGRNPALFTPIFFNVSQGSRLGLGTEDLPDGTERNIGTTRWPYSTFCLEAISRIRPPALDIYAETSSRPQRSLDCDVMARAEVSPGLAIRYPAAQGEVVDLVARDSRTVLDRAYQFEAEEFYNFNPTVRPVTISPRSCQVPMFLHRSRRAEGVTAGAPENCPPRGSTVSTIDGAPVAVVSTRYSETKQLLGSEDVVWGFHPLAFEPGGVRSALRWILGSRWELPGAN